MNITTEIPAVPIGTWLPSATQWDRSQTCRSSVQLPLQVLGARTISRKSHVSARGSLTLRFAGASILALIAYESKLESDFVVLTAALADVTSIISQPFVVPYLDRDGTYRRYTPDFLVTFRTGRRLIVEVKPAALARRRRTRDMLRLVKRALPQTLADDVRLFTDECYDRLDAVNAEQFHACHQDPDAEADGLLAEAIKGLYGTLPVRELARLSRLDARGYPAIVRALNFGRLRQLTPGYYGPMTLVAPGDV